MSTRRPRVIRSTALIGMVAALAACSSPPNPAPVVEYHPAYLSYATVPELEGAADAIVEVKVLDAAVKVLDIDSGNGVSDPQQNPAVGASGELADGTFVYTVMRTEVVACAKGRYLPGDIVEVRQLGGSVNSRAYVEAGGYPLAVGDTYVLLLDEWAAEGLPATILSPAQGILTVQADGSLAPAVAGDQVATQLAETLATQLH